MSAVAELTRETAPVRVPAAPDRLSLLRQAGDGRMPYPALVRLLGAATTAGTAIDTAAAGTATASGPGPRSAAPPDAPGSRPARPRCSR